MRLLPLASMSHLRWNYKKKKKKKKLPVFTASYGSISLVTPNLDLFFWLCWRNVSFSLFRARFSLITVDSWSSCGKVPSNIHTDIIVVLVMVYCSYWQRLAGPAFWLGTGYSYSSYMSQAAFDLAWRVPLCRRVEQNSITPCRWKAIAPGKHTCTYLWRNDKQHNA